MSDALFDRDQYRSPRDREPRTKRSKPKPKPTADSDGFWFVVTTTAGVMEFCHRINDKQPHSDLGSVLTKCDQTGRLLERIEPGVAIHPCPRCLDAK